MPSQRRTTEVRVSGGWLTHHNTSVGNRMDDIA